MIITNLDTNESITLRPHQSAAKWLIGVKRVFIHASTIYASNGFNRSELVYVKSDCACVDDRAFKHCRHLDTIDLNTCIIIGTSAFNGCSNLSTVYISNCTSIGKSAFKGCVKLLELELNKCRYLADNAFADCVGLTKLDANECQALGDHVFKGCPNMKTINLYKCSELPAYTFFNLTNASVNTSNCKYIDPKAFQHCVKSSADVSDLLMVNLDRPEIRHACGWETSFSKCQYISKNMPGTKMEWITSLILDNVEFINPYTFIGWKNLTYVEIPKCKYIGTAAFKDCINLEYVVSDNLKFVAAYGFYRCHKLIEVDLDNCERIEEYALTYTQLKKIPDNCPTHYSNMHDDFTSEWYEEFLEELRMVFITYKTRREWLGHVQDVFNQYPQPSTRSTIEDRIYDQLKLMSIRKLRKVINEIADEYRVVAGSYCHVAPSNTIFQHKNTRYFGTISSPISEYMYHVPCLTIPHLTDDRLPTILECIDVGILNIPNATKILSGSLACHLDILNIPHGKFINQSGIAVEEVRDVNYYKNFPLTKSQHSQLSDYTYTYSNFTGMVELANAWILTLSPNAAMNCVIDMIQQSHQPQKDMAKKLRTVYQDLRKLNIARMINLIQKYSRPDYWTHDKEALKQAYRRKCQMSSKDSKREDRDESDMITEIDE